MLIGEVAERSGISSRMLRHYDKIGVLSPSDRTTGGYRHYTEADLHRLFHVEGLRSLGLSLKEIAAVLDRPAFVPLSLVEQLIVRCRERITQQQDLLRTLERVQESDPADWADVVRIIGLLRGLEAYSPSARLRLALSLANGERRDELLLTEAALRETDPTVAGTLYWALAGSGGDLAVPALRAALASPLTERRRRAVEALEKINTDRSIAAIAGALGHPDPLVNGRAALAAGASGDAAAIPVLVDLIVEGRDDDLAAGVLGVLAAEHNLATHVGRAIEDALARSDSGTRLRLVNALAVIPGPQFRDRLTALTEDADRRVALAARFALETGGPAT